MTLTSEDAQRMILASHAKAQDLGIAVSAAIFDSEGRLFAFGRMEGAHWLTVEVSQAKAYTGVLLRRDGPELQQMPPATLTALSNLHGRGVMAMGSVTVVREDRRVIAAVGCSGGTDEQDGECARAARDAFVT